MLGRRWTSAIAAAFGGLLGLFAFLLKQFVMPVPLRDQLLELCVAIGVGAIGMIVIVSLRNHWWQRANQLHDVRRNIDIIP
jgi:hypothetical protein